MSTVDTSPDDESRGRLAAAVLSRAEQVTAAAHVMSFRGSVVADVQFAGTVVWAVVHIDQEEHRRRAEAGLGPVEDRHLWEVLVNLPYGIPIRWSALDPIEAAVLDVAPRGVIESSGDSLVRLIRPAATLSGVLAVGRPWRSTVDRASRFSAQCPRAALVDGGKVSSTAARYASELGVGVALAGDCGVHLIAMPAPARRRVVGQRLFRLQEAAYRAWVRRESLRTVPMPGDGLERERPLHSPP